MKPNRLTIPLLILLGPASFAQLPGSAPYLDSALAPERRAADLVSRMTQEEKGAPDAEQRARNPASWGRCLQLLERGSARRCLGAGHGVPGAIGLGASFGGKVRHSDSAEALHGFCDLSRDTRKSREFLSDNFSETLL